MSFETSVGAVFQFMVTDMMTNRKFVCLVGLRETSVFGGCFFVLWFGDFVCDKVLGGIWFLCQYIIRIYLWDDIFDKTLHWLFMSIFLCWWIARRFSFPVSMTVITIGFCQYQTARLIDKFHVVIQSGNPITNFKELLFACLNGAYV